MCASQKSKEEAPQRASGQPQESIFDIKKLILMTPGWHGTGGIERVSAEAILALVAVDGRNGMNREVWSLEAHPPDNGVPASQAWKMRFANRSRSRFALWGARAAIKNQKHTLIVCLHLHLAPVALPMMARGARLAVFLHGIEAWDALSAMRTRALLKAHRLLANSACTIRRFKEANPKLAKRAVAQCHLGIPDSPLPVPASAPQDPFCLIAGRMASGERYKGHDVLLEIWPEVRKEIPHARLVIAGDGDDRPRLEGKAALLKLQDSVRFLGRVDEASLQALYRDCAFFAMPSSGEGFGLVFLEAMRAGKACIGGPGAAAEVIEDGKTGVVADPASPERILEAVTRLFKRPDLCAKWGAAGRLRFLERFTRERFQGRFLDALGLAV